MKPEILEVTKAPGGTQMRVHAVFEASDVGQMLHMASHSAEAQEGDLDTEVLAPAAAELMVPWVMEALDFETVMDPVVISMDDLLEGQECEIVVDVVPKPAFELSSYDPVKITLPKVEVTDAHVEARMNDIAMSAAQVASESVDRAVEFGDHIVFSIKTNRHGRPMPHLTSHSQIYDVGTGMFSSDFDDNLVGMVVGEPKTFDFRAKGLDEKGNEEIDTLTATVVVKDIKERVAPEITDAWVEAIVEGADSVDELKAMIRAELEDQLDRELNELASMLAADELAKRLDGLRIPDEMHTYTQAQITNELDMHAQAQGTTLADLRATSSMSATEIDAAIALQARAVIVQGYALDAWFRHFGLELTDADMQDFFAQESSGGIHPDIIRLQYEKAGRMHTAREAAARAKALKNVVTTADITYEEMPQSKA